MSTGELPSWYRDPDNWNGSSFEVAIEFGRSADTLMEVALAAAWASPGITAIGGLDPVEPGTTRERANDAGVGQPGRGTIALPPDGLTTGIVIATFTDSDSNWISIGIPTAMLERVFPVTYPLDGGANRWTDTVARGLVAVAESVFRVVPFDFALVGEEVLGSYSLTASDPDRRVILEILERTGGMMLSPALWTSLRPTVPAERLSSGIWWVPPRAGTRA